jgi:hypothetical protein
VQIIAIFWKHLVQKVVDISQKQQFVLDDFDGASRMPCVDIQDAIPLKPIEKDIYIFLQGGELLLREVFLNQRFQDILLCC